MDTRKLQRRSTPELYGRVRDMAYMALEGLLDPRPNSAALRRRWGREFQAIRAELRRRGEDVSGLEWPSR